MSRRRATRAITLIELLIDTAVLAIMAAGIFQGVGAAHQAMERQENRRLAVALCEDQIQLLRSKETLPEPGAYPIEPELAASNPLAARADVEIRPGPGPTPSLVEARVTVRLYPEAPIHDVTISALLAAPEKGGAR